VPDGGCSLPSKPPADELTPPDALIGHCSLEAVLVAAADPGAFADVVGDVSEIERLCKSTLFLVDANEDNCPAHGPWFFESDYRISMIVPLEQEGCFGVLGGLAFWHDGTEESSLVNIQRVRSRDPVDAYIEMEVAEESCSDREHGEEICGLHEIARNQTVITGLADGSFLLTMVSADVPGDFEAPRVELVDGAAEIRACGDRTRIELPPSVAAAQRKAEPELKRAKAAAEQAKAAAEQAKAEAKAAAKQAMEYAEQAKAAAERCNDGWVMYINGDLAGATIDIDTALSVLEHAVDEHGRRNLGTCLYNRGRIAEAAGDKARAIELYRRSLDARPSATVQAWLDSLLEP
jgi:hypothetical protein